MCIEIYIETISANASGKIHHQIIINEKNTHYVQCGDYTVFATPPATDTF